MTPDTTRPNLKAGQTCPTSGRVFRSWINGKTKWTTQETWDRERKAAATKRQSMSLQEREKWALRKRDCRKNDPGYRQRENVLQQARREKNPTLVQAHNRKASIRCATHRAEDAEWREMQNAKKRTEEARRHQREYVRRRASVDMLFMVKRRLRVRMAKVFRTRKIPKTGHLGDAIGCSWEVLKQHIESKFLPGMTWDNRDQWHIDHEVPLVTAKTEEEIFKLCHYTNLQPLWAMDNQQKGCKLPSFLDTLPP